MSCKTSYNVLSHFLWGLGAGSSFFLGGRGSLKFGGGGVVKKDSLPMLGLQRLTSL